MTDNTAFTFFWRAESPFSQWHRSIFTIDGVRYTCAEQYMMRAKALLFGDTEIAERIMASESPREHQSLGRKVRGFNQAVWERERENIVRTASRAKFSQNSGLKKKLMATGHTELVEASPVDRIWGVGLAADDPRITDRASWRGLNLLGKILTEVRDELCHTARA